MILPTLFHGTIIYEGMNNDFRGKEGGLKYIYTFALIDFSMKVGIATKNM